MVAGSTWTTPLLTLMLLFAFQGSAILKQPLIVALVAVPIQIQAFFSSSSAYLLNRVACRERNRVYSALASVCVNSSRKLVRYVWTQPDK